MTIKQVADIIAKNDYLFQVSIPNNTSYSHDRTTPNSGMINSEIVEACLNNIVDANKAKSLFVRVFKYNGGKNGKGGLEQPPGYLIEQLGNQSETNEKPIGNQSETNQKPIENQLKTNEKPIGNQSEQQKQTPPPTQNPMENKDYFDFKVLQIANKQLEHNYEESKLKQKELESKIDKLHDENKQLLRDNLVKEDKHELALERARLDMDKESKTGLSGLMGELSANPQIIEAVVGFINPKHPMFDKEPQITLEGAPDNNREIKYTDDATVNMMLNDIPRVLSQKDGETMTKIYLLFQEFISKPESLDQAVSTFLPDYKY